MATITDVYPSYAKAGDSAIKVIGTGFLDAPNETKVYHRRHGQTAWENVDPTRVTFVSATELTIAIDAANTDGWDNGLNDVGVSDSGETTPDGFVAQALFFFTAGALKPPVAGLRTGRAQEWGRWRQSAPSGRAAPPP